MGKNADPEKYKCYAEGLKHFSSKPPVFIKTFLFMGCLFDLYFKDAFYLVKMPKGDMYVPFALVNEGVMMYDDSFAEIQRKHREANYNVHTVIDMTNWANLEKELEVML